MVRLGSKLSFREAAEEVWYMHRTEIPEATLRQTTHKHGLVVEEITQEETERLERTAPKSDAKPENLLLSTDGAFIRTTTEEWVEVKTTAIGEFVLGKGENRPRTSQISYFSRQYEARKFEKHALGELHRRGIDNAKLVVSVNDGASWIQSFLEYHCPEAVRINDFAHSASYLAQAGKAVYGEGDTFKQWFQTARRNLKNKPPRETVGALNLLKPKAKDSAASQDIDVALYYLQTRESLIDYAHFQKQGYPIGSGMVESAHKVVVQKRMKGAGMRWAEGNINGMLALRNLVCNSRWEEGWTTIVNRPQSRRQRCSDETPPPRVEKLTFKSVEVAEEACEDVPMESKDSRENHPWRQGKWPTYEMKWLN